MREAEKYAFWQKKKLYLVGFSKLFILVELPDGHD